MPAATVHPGDLYHTGIVVPDLDAAKAEYAGAFGYEWGFGGSFDMPVLLVDGPRTVTFRFAYSAAGPHRLELVEEMPGTLWTAPAPGATHHLGYWCDDVPAASVALTASGAPRVAVVGAASDDEPPNVVIHRLASGAHIELVAREMRAAMFPGD